MSAFLMSRVALSNLAWEYVLGFEPTLKRHWRKKTGLWFSPRPATREQMIETVFQVLLKENLRSLKARYGSRSECDRVTSSDWHAIAAANGYAKNGRNYPWIIMICRCYDYQCFETADYPFTIAAKMIRDLKIMTAKRFAETMELPEVEFWGAPVPGFAKLEE